MSVLIFKIFIGKFIFRNAGEPAIKAPQSRIISLRNARTVPRNPPAYNPKSNGPCEKAAKDATTRLRVIKTALEKPVGIKIGENLQIMEWAIEHA